MGLQTTSKGGQTGAGDTGGSLGCNDHEYQQGQLLAQLQRGADGIGHGDGSPGHVHAYHSPPIYNDVGDVVGLVSADVSLDNISAEAWAQVPVLIALAAALFLVSSIVSGGLSCDWSRP